MPQGKGTYGSKRGRPSSKGSKSSKSTLRKSRINDMGIKKKKKNTKAKGGKGNA